MHASHSSSATPNHARSKWITITIIIYTLTLFCLSANAQSNVIPTYTPGGSIPNLSLYDLLSPLPQLQQNGWWYFVGLLNDEQKEEHSLQVTIIRSGTSMMGIASLGFSFKNPAGKTLYLWNLYPTGSLLSYLPVATLKNKPANSNGFFIGIQSHTGDQTSPFLYRFAHNVDDAAHWVGQIGAQYTLTANGTGEIGATQNNPELVSYQLNVQMQDQRGLVPEGFGGFVGPNAFQSNPTSDTASSWEVAQPNLRILQWTMIITPMGNTANALLSQPITFSNNNTHDQLWLDRQVLYKPRVDSTASDALIAAKTSGVLPTSDQQPLYFGTWMSFCFNHTGLKGICGDAVAIWQPNTTTNVMDSDTTATSGFINLFTPDSNGAGFPTRIGSTQTEVLTINGAQKDLPFQIQNDPNATFISPLSHHTYGKVVYVTIRKNTPFSALLHEQLDSVSYNSDLQLKFVALSRQTENVPGNYDDGFYEGAAHVFLCDNAAQACQLIGTGFIEEMGYH